MIDGNLTAQTNPDGSERTKHNILADEVYTFCCDWEYNNDRYVSPEEPDGQLREIGIAALKTVVENGEPEDRKHLKGLFRRVGVVGLSEDDRENEEWTENDWEIVLNYIHTQWPPKVKDSEAELEA